MQYSRKAGFTLIELMVSVTVLALIMYSFGLIIKNGEEAYRSAQSSVSLETRARQAMSRVVSELAGAGLEMVWPDPSTDYGTPTLSFQKAEDVVDGAITWGPMTRLAFVYAEGELDDDTDNNGNGLVDEGAIELTRDVGGPDEKSVIICRDVAEFLPGEIFNGADDNGNDIKDENGFNAHLTGRVLTIRISLVALDANGRLHDRTTTTSVRLRN